MTSGYASDHSRLTDQWAPQNASKLWCANRGLPSGPVRTLQTRVASPVLSQYAPSASLTILRPSSECQRSV